MKSVLLFANDDPALETRLCASVALVRAAGGHLTCLHATPYQAFIMGDPFGGIYAMANVVEALGEAEARQRERIEARLAGEGVSWSWMQIDGPPASTLALRSSLADLVVLSLPEKSGEIQSARHSLVADVAVHGRAPVLAIPAEFAGAAIGGPVLVAWNGSPEAANALRAALPLLALAPAICLATVAETVGEFPASEASGYLARHGLACQSVELAGDAGGPGPELLDCAAALDASCIVMGAYGHSRWREAVLGGVTRHMIETSAIPLLLSH